MLAFDPISHNIQTEKSERKDAGSALTTAALENGSTETWKSNSMVDSTNQAFFFMYQMKLLNTLGLVKSVCKPWGTVPHGNDFAYHFNKIATTNSLSLLQCYESVFRTIYDRFDAEGSDPDNAAASLWAKVEDVDYFKVIYRLECMRHNKPFDNDIYKEMLERTMHNVDLEQELEQELEVSNFDEVPTWGKYNWESRNRQYSLTRLEDEAAVLSDVDISEVFNGEEPKDEDFDNSDLIYTGSNTIEIEDVYFNEQAPYSVELQTERAYNTRSKNDFGRVVMQVMSKQSHIPQSGQNAKTGRSTRQTTYSHTNVTRPRATSRRQTSYYRDDGDYFSEHQTKATSSVKRDEESRRRKKKHVEPAIAAEGYNKALSSARTESSTDDTQLSRNMNVVSASVSYDKRQQRFMAQWKTREGTKHSKSFYAKRYASPIMARKHAELYKMYILQHRGKFMHDVPEPTYEQLASQNFEALENIKISDTSMMEDFDRPS